MTVHIGIVEIVALREKDKIPTVYKPKNVAISSGLAAISNW